MVLCQCAAVKASLETYTFFVSRAEYDTYENELYKKCIFYIYITKSS